MTNKEKSELFVNWYIKEQERRKQLKRKSERDINGHIFENKNRIKKRIGMW